MNVCFLKFYKTCFLFLFIASLFSCTEVITEQETVQNVTQNTYCEVSFSLNGNGDSSSRAAELKQLVKDELYYTVDVIKENGTTEKTYPESGAWTYSELYKAKLRLSAGKWKFTLKAYNDDKKSILVLISGQTSMEIKAGTNRIKFEMKEPVDGIGDFTMKMNLGSDVNEVTAKLCHLDGTDVTTEELGSIWSESDGKIEQSWLKSDFTTSDDGKTSYVEYNIKNIKKGYYMVCWKFSKENENEPQTFNSLATVVTGCANSDSYDVREDANKNPDVVSYYSVFYDLNVEVESLVKLPDGITLKDTKLYKEGDDVKIITFELVREGYDFVGWRPDSTHIYQVPENKDTPVKFKMQTANVKLTASWIPSNSTKYTVRHWRQKLNESGTAVSGTDKTITEPTAAGESAICVDYALLVTDILSGTTENLTEVKAESYEGFEAQAFSQKTIVADGSTIVDVFYNRKTNTPYTVKHYLQNLDETGTETVGNYEMKLTEKKSGVTGVWTSAEAKSSYVGFAAKIFSQAVINADGSTVIDIYYNRNTDTAYTVNHYLQKLNDDGSASEDYKLNDSVEGKGITGAWTKAEAKSYIGFTVQNFSQKEIAADGGTIVKIYYNRNANTAYKVRHWQQKLNAEETGISGDDKTITEPLNDMDSATCKDYKLFKIDVDNYGITGSLTKAKTETYTGFNMPDVEQKPIAENGSTIVDIFYDRNRYTLTYEDGVDNEEIKVPGPSNFYYGAKVVAKSSDPRTGYYFKNWERSDTKEPLEVGATMPAADLKLTASWTARTDTKYTVRHWKQKLNESQNAASGTDKTIEIDGETVTCKDYDLVAPDTNKFGTTAMKTNVEAIKYIGFTAPSIDEIDQKTIEADGSTVVDVFCNRESYPVTYDDGVKNESIDVPNDAYWCYGATVKVSEEVPLRTGYTFLGWTDNESATVVKYSKGGEMSFEMKAAPITLYALWEKNAIPGGSIKISKNEYAEMEIFKCEVIGDNKDVLRFTVVDGYVDCKWWIGNDDVSKTGTTYDWDTSNVASGIYDITLNAKDINGTHRSQTMTVVIEK